MSIFLPLSQSGQIASGRPEKTQSRGMQEAFYGKEVIVADREMVESRIEVILDGADKEDVAFMVVGDPFGCAAAIMYS